MSTPNNTSGNKASSAVPYRSSRWPARLLIWTGIGHNLVGLFVKKEMAKPFMEAVQGGYVNQFARSTARCNAFWFLIVGFNLVMLGRVVDWYLFPDEQEQAPHIKDKEKKQKTEQSLVRSERVLPRELGYWFVGIGVAGATALPIGGFYLLIGQGAALLLAK
ncbi:hypothetical protein BGX29_007721 [Mortierella sp. GBA35]|nr:hypothetical protein BGX29_007721 [Mortierella sp. GBA35]